VSCVPSPGRAKHSHLSVLPNGVDLAAGSVEPEGSGPSASTTRGSETAAAVSRIVEHLGFGGGASVLWTIVVCVALWKISDPTLRWLWPYLFWTWVVVAGLWFLGFVIAAVKGAGKTPPSPAAAPPPISRHQPETPQLAPRAQVP
jgi:hypothetical protein